MQKYVFVNLEGSACMRTLALQMRLAKAEKRFSQCSLLQRSLTEMQILTDGLPSVREIEEEIRYILCEIL